MLFVVGVEPIGPVCRDEGLLGKRCRWPSVYCDVICSGMWRVLPVSPDNILDMLGDA